MKKYQRVLSYILVAVLAAGLGGAATWMAMPKPGKLDQLEGIISEKFIGEKDETHMEDAAAAAMIGALGDRWSYYITAADYDAYQEQMKNSYVGIGITIQMDPDTDELHVIAVQKGGSAEEAGVQVGDVIAAVDGQSASELQMAGVRDAIRGREGTSVPVTVRRGEEEITMDIMRKALTVPAAESQMIEDNTGYVRINNFHERSAADVIQQIEALKTEGMEKLILDVRFNPGGYVTELVDLLDYLLPEGDLFKSVDFRGDEKVYTSDASFLDMPMAVLVNGDSYSAAEFFAAALREYDAAFVVGEPTCGKGYFQITYRLQDGSAVGLSVGKYFTPKGESLIGVGITPEIQLNLEPEQAAQVAAQSLPLTEDPQIIAAFEALKNGKNP